MSFIIVLVNHLLITDHLGSFFSLVGSNMSLLTATMLQYSFSLRHARHDLFYLITCQTANIIVFISIRLTFEV